MKTVITLFFIVLYFLGFSQDLPSVKIGNQIWSKKNLDTTIFRNGEVIKEIHSKEDWLKAGYREEPAWCYYNFDSKNANLGKLYNYYAVSDPRNIAPLGWKVPSLQDYYALVKFLDPLCTTEYFEKNGSLTGGNLKSKDSLWNGRVCPQINSNFNAIPAGGYSPSIDYPNFDWNKKGENARLWCITNWDSIVLFTYSDTSNIEEFKRKIKSEKLKDKAIVIRLYNYSCKIDADDDPKLCGYSLRLLKQFGEKPEEYIFPDK